MKSRLGALVKTYRQRLGWSQEELAWQAGMHRTYVADIERGARNVTFVRLIQLVQALRTPMSDFFHALESYFQPPIETEPRAKSARAGPAALRGHSPQPAGRTK